MVNRCSGLQKRYQARLPVIEYFFMKQIGIISAFR